MPSSTITKCAGGDSHGPLPACLPMSQYTWGYTVAAYPIGGIVGSFVSKYANAHFSRRANIMAACVLFMIGNVISAVSVNIPMYAVGRAIVGVAAGMCGSSTAIYVAEVSTNRSRGALGSLFEMFLNLGILLSQVAGRYMNEDPMWRFLWGISAILACGQLLFMFFFTVECPRRLCAVKEYDAAAAALQKLRAGADIEEEYAQMLAARQRETDSAVPQMSIWDILSGKNKHILWRTVIVMVLQAYNQAPGIGPMSVYSHTIFEAMFQGNSELASNLVMANGTVNTAATFIAIACVHKVGRKNLMLASLFGTCLGSILMCVGAYHVEQPGIVIAASLIFLSTYSLGCGVIPWFIAPELVPMHALASANALGSASNWATNFLFNLVWPYMNTGLGNNAFIVFIAINAAGFLFVFFCMPETTGQSLDHEETKSGDNAVESGASSENGDKKQVEYVDKE
ncbi:general substrate transporter [Gongronella butleri]|nr:general substrate transporter [Gongronella butleri]